MLQQQQQQQQQQAQQAQQGQQAGMVSAILFAWGGKRVQVPLNYIHVQYHTYSNGTYDPIQCKKLAFHGFS